MSFLNSVAPYVQLDDFGKAALFDKMERHVFPKGTILVAIGDICRSVYFIERGICRSFYIKDGKEVTEAIFTAYSFACSLNSYHTRQPDMRQREVLETSVIWTLPYHELEKLYASYPSIERLGRHIITLELTAAHKRTESLKFCTAQERYHKFIEEEEGLLQHVPLGIIASYLGMTQETLSRIRAANVF